MFLPIHSHKVNAIDIVGRTEIKGVWVDDDDFYCKQVIPMIAEMFKFSGQQLKVEVFPLAMPALARIKSSMPDIILTNIFMPAQDGIQLIKMIRQCNKEVPIYVVSSRCFGATIQRIEAAGANGYLLKGELTKEGIQMLQHEINVLTSKNA